MASNQATSPLEVAALSAPPAQPQQQPRRELPSPVPVPVPSQPTPTPMQAPTSTYLVGFTPAARAEAPPPQTVVAPVQLPAAPAASEPLVDTRPAVVAPAPEPTPVPALNVPTKPATANVPARAPAATRAPAVAGTAVLTLTADRPDQNRPQPQPRVEIANGNGVVGMAAKLSGFLRSRGVVQHAALSNLAPFNTTASVVYYRPGFAAAAKALADRAPYRIEVAAAPGGTTSNADLRVVLGRDVRLAAACERNCVIAGAPAPLPAAVDAGADVGADVRADAGAVSGFASGDATSAPDRPSPLVAAWLAVLAR